MSLPSAPGGDASADPGKAASLEADAGGMRGKVRAFFCAYALVLELVHAARPGTATHQLTVRAPSVTVCTCCLANSGIVCRASVVCDVCTGEPSGGTRRATAASGPQAPRARVSARCGCRGGPRWLRRASACRGGPCRQWEGGLSPGGASAANDTHDALARRPAAVAAGAGCASYATQHRGHTIGGSGQRAGRGCSPAFRLFMAELQSGVLLYSYLGQSASVPNISRTSCYIPNHSFKAVMGATSQDSHLRTTCC